MHHDISAGNILLVRVQDDRGKYEWSGRLIDWDLCMDNSRSSELKVYRAVRIVTLLLCSPANCAA
jgi:hypothetical protein